MEVRDWYTCTKCGSVWRWRRSDVGKCPHCAELTVPLEPPSVGVADGRATLATRLLRLAGYLADQAVTAVLLVPALFAAAHSEAVGRTGIGTFLSALTWATIGSAVYYAVPTALCGQTLGKWIAGTKAIGPDGQAPGWVRAIVRSVVALAADLLTSFVVGFLDPLWLLWDRRRQTLHDKAAGTVVVVVRRSRPVPVLLAGIALAAGTQLALVFGVIRPFIVQAYYVPSGSMHHTLMEHDRLLANKLSYRYGDLQRGDIIVFRAPTYVTHGKRIDFVKRLVGLPGDTLQVKGGRLLVNGRAQDESYLAEPYMTYRWGPVKVPPDSVVAMGDNRNNSNDSTKWVDAAGKPAPFLPISSIHGRAFYRFWPWPRRGPVR